MIIDTRAINKSESLVIRGSINEDIWELEESDLVKPSGPLNYSVEASIIGEDLLVRGDFSIKFTFQCSHCLDLFEKTINLNNHSLLSSIEGNSTIDLTNALREDILLALPNFPKCDQGDGKDDPCPASGKFTDGLNAENNGEKSENEPPSKQWEALDQFNID
jgi:uncharacterized metal-binding protein YceD (DUF177 family)